MCDYKNNKKIEDCGSCGCGQSSKEGKHGRRVKAGTVKIDKAEVTTYKCADCGTYLH